MKKSKLGKVLTVLVIIAICLISFGGILVKKQGQMQNLLPDYNLGMNLSGARVAKFVVSDETQEIIYDAEGNVATDGKNEDGSLKEGYTKQEKKVNSEEILNEENYAQAKNIIEKRLKKMGVSEFNVRQNSKTGEMIIEIPEDTYTDEVIGNLTYAGKFEIKDSQTDEVLIDNKNIKASSAVYGSTETGTAVYLSIEFNKEGKQKLEEITKTYISSTDEEGNDTTKKISIELDDETMLETYFGETITTGILQLSIGSPSTSNEEVASYIKQANMVASLIDSGDMKIHYELEENNYISAPIDNLIAKSIFGIILVILVVGFIYWIVRYKLNGIFAVISYIGMIATSLLAIRYANVTISIEAIVSLVSILVANYFFMQYVLKELVKGEENKTEIIKQAYKRYASILCPLLIVAVVFTFTTWLPITSIGMTLFWGMFVATIYNYIVIKLLLDRKEK